MDENQIYENNYDEVKRISHIEPTRTLIDLPKTTESMHVVTITEERKKTLKKKLSRSNSIGNVQGLLKIFDDIQIANEIRKSSSFEDVQYESLEFPTRRRTSGLTLWNWSKKEEKTEEKPKESEKENEKVRKRKKSKLTEIGIRLGRRISVTFGDLFLNKLLSIDQNKEKKANMNVSPPSSPPQLPPRPNRQPQSRVRYSSSESEGYLSPENDNFEPCKEVPSPEYEELPVLRNPNRPPSPPPITHSRQPRLSDTRLTPRASELSVAKDISQTSIQSDHSNGNRIDDSFKEDLNRIISQPKAKNPSSNRSSNTSDTGSDSSRKRMPLPKPPIENKPTFIAKAESKKRNSIDLCPWYHGNITRPLGNSLLENEKDGTFLIRDSQKANQPYTIMIKDKSKIFNLRIRRIRNPYPRLWEGYAIGEEKPNEEYFPSVATMIEKFRQEPLSLSNDVSVILQDWVVNEDSPETNDNHAFQTTNNRSPCFNIPNTGYNHCSSLPNFEYLPLAPTKPNLGEEDYLEPTKLSERQTPCLQNGNENNFQVNPIVEGRISPRKISSEELPRLLNTNRPLPEIPKSERKKKQPPKVSSLRPADQPWYHGDISRKDGNEKLLKINQNGSFLIRKSTGGNQKQPFTLMILCKYKVLNIKIRRKSDGHFAIGEEKLDEPNFQTLSELVCFHKKNPIQFLGRESGVIMLGTPATK
ncbi:DgyrCDS7060 [Dimorphilus gyrociliatus]|uniref:DgyrCDS7060 n=1 Tax=Dimorphilus gyrociliatus TaxID=2664684 RepID=A0A7I8VS59_9ANNE|nr:DgyrCDS7060 [Dimorphilus gyrociliatus]